MNRRVAGALAVVVAGGAWYAAGARLVTPDAVARSLRAGGTALVVLVVLAALLALAHQYRRWRAYRPAIHLAVILVAFVVVAALWLDPPDPFAGDGTLSADEASTIRVAGLGLLFAVLLTLAHHFDGDDR